MITGIPVNIVCGPLGVGKTTVINELLSHRPVDERWAVLINEYGLIGLDAALLDTPAGDDTMLKEVAGGCICCSAGPVFAASLIQLLRRRPDRVLIEPTGLATLSGILDTLAREGIAEAVEVRSVICLLNPASLARDLQREEVCDQVDAADVLLATRADVATPSQRDDFAAWGEQLFPPRLHVGTITYGQGVGRWLDAPRSSQPTRPKGSGHRHAIDHGVDRGATPKSAGIEDATAIVRREHRSGVTTTIGWVCDPSLQFDGQRVERCVEAMTTLPGMRRLKAVLHTEGGWLAFNVTDADAPVPRRSAYRRDSRLELIVEHADPVDADALEVAFRACLRRR